jgi:hypothetical protein
MNDLRPILQDDPTEREKLLIDSARLDVPPAAAKGRMLAALGFAAVTTTTAGAGGATTVATSGAARLIKWLAISAIGSAITLGAVEGLSPPLSEMAGNTPIAESEAKPEPPSSPGRALDAPEWKVPRTVPAPIPTMRAVAAMPAVPATPAAKPVSGQGSTFGGSPPQPTLTAEVAALAEARHALASGDAATSLGLLDGYDRRFAQPILTLEATVLRVEALVALGRIDEARGLARGMLAAHPDSPYAQRVRSLIGTATSPIP